MGSLPVTGGDTVHPKHLSEHLVVVWWNDYHSSTVYTDGKAPDKNQQDFCMLVSSVLCLHCFLVSPPEIKKNCHLMKSTRCMPACS
jgi:hypothetical protein